MAYTSHGWHIPGTSDFAPPPNRARCGGIKFCPECGSEAASLWPYLDTSDESSEVYDQVLSVSISDEELRLKCLALAVELKARFTQVDRPKNTIEVAQLFFDYIRPQGKE